MQRTAGKEGVEVLLLGNAQDGGFPQFGCHCDCCESVLSGRLKSESAVSLAVLDHDTKKYWLIDASMQLHAQWHRFGGLLAQYTLSGVFLTHAHVGHYLGLPYLGKECCNAQQLPLYASQMMHAFLRKNQPFQALYENENVTATVINDEESIEMHSFTVTPHLVGHRAEFTDTFAFTIETSSKKLFFCPDIDSWRGLQPKCLRRLLMERDYLLLDATFYDDHELPGRDMSTIPHPRVVDTVREVRETREEGVTKGVEGSAANQCGRVTLIHLNHSNRLWHRQEDLVCELAALDISIGEAGQSWHLE